MSPPFNLTWRECGYCGTPVRSAYCNDACTYQAQRLRDVEAGVRRPNSRGTGFRYAGAVTSEWEEAERECRLRIARRLVQMGCDVDIAVDEAGFLRTERETVFGALRRRGVKWDNPHASLALRA